MHKWVGFYVRKLIEGKAHGGHYASVNDVFIYYETYGAGPPVLVLHGGLGSIEGMSRQSRALAKSHLVIAADSRGHGRSTDSNVQLSYALMSDDMSKLLDHLQIDRVDVVGWSDGAIIGLDLAMRHPECIRKLVAISANYDVDGLVEMPSLDSEYSACATSLQTSRAGSCSLASVLPQGGENVADAAALHTERTWPHQSFDSHHGG